MKRISIEPRAIAGEATKLLPSTITAYPSGYAPGTLSITMHNAEGLNAGTRLDADQAVELVEFLTDWITATQVESLLRSMECDEEEAA